MYFFWFQYDKSDQVEGKETSGINLPRVTHLGIVSFCHCNEY